MEVQGGRVIQLLNLPALDRASTRQRLDCVIAIFQAIESGELLAAMPECEVARREHNTALRLLALAEKELVSLRLDLED